MKNPEKKGVSVEQKRKSLNETLPVSPEVWVWTGATGVTFKEVREPSGTYYREGTPRAVVRGLELARKTCKYIRLWYGDSKTGKAWVEENDVFGYVGSSTGPLKVPLLLENGTSCGGPSIMVDCIVKLKVGGKVVYAHRQLDLGSFTVRELPRRNQAGYTHAVDVDGIEHARFKSFVEALHWAEFMTGKRDRIGDQTW